MLKPMIAISLMLIFGGCSKQDQPLAASKKARLTIELIIDNSRCSSFKNRLVSPLMDDDAIDKIYQEAMKARCINKDV